MARSRRFLAVLAALIVCAGFSASVVGPQVAAAPPANPAAPAVKPVAPSEALALDQKIINDAKSGSEIMANLTYLSDIIGPRLTGSVALKRANEWAAEKMKSYGLTNVRLEPWSIPAGWERGTATARLIEPNNGRSITLASMGWSPGTKGKIEGDVVVLNAKNSAELKAYKGKLKNAIILRGPPATIRPIGDQNPFGGPNMNPGQVRRMQRNFAEMMAFFRELSEFLRTEGVAVMLQDAGKPQGLLTVTGGWRGGDRASAPEPLPSCFVAHEHYALLHRLATRPAPARTRLEIEITNKFIPGPIVVYNTVGEIRGSEKPDEFMVLGAHLDSWDLGQGTTDNGTGSAVVLEAARILGRCGVRPKRTIRFALFTGEEQGIYGSKEYVKRHKDEMPRTSLCLVHDTGTGKVIGLGLQNRVSIKPILDKELVSLKALGLTDINLRGMGGSDHMSFEQAGVPGFAVQQDWAEYRLTHHSQSDTLDKAHEADLIQGAQVMAVTAIRVANLPILLPRDKKVEPRNGRPLARAQVVLL
jgi:hypothetical protein